MLYGMFAFCIAFAISFIPPGFRLSDEEARDRTESETEGLATGQFEQDRSPKEKRALEPRSISGSGSASLAPGEISINRLLDNFSVQEELELEDEQLETLGSIYMSLVSDHDYQHLVRRYRSAQGEEREALFRAMTFQQDAMDRRLLGVLNEDQRDRLLQIAIQNGGIEALKLSVMLDRLYLRPGQRERILGILAAKEENEAELFRQLQERIASVNEGPLPREERLALISELKEHYELAVQQNHERAVRALGRTLSRGQKRRFEALAGEPFDLTVLRSDHRVHRGPPPEEVPATEETDTDEPMSKPEAESDDPASVCVRPLGFSGSGLL